MCRSCASNKIAPGLEVLAVGAALLFLHGSSEVNSDPQLKSDHSTKHRLDCLPGQKSGSSGTPTMKFVPRRAEPYQVPQTALIFDRRKRQVV